MNRLLQNITLKAYISLLFALLSGSVFAQHNFHKFGIGAGLGFTQAFADLPRHDLGTAGYGNLDYYFTPFLSLGAELQKGKIKAESSTGDESRRRFVNSYTAAAVNGKLYLGALADYRGNNFLNAIKGLYIGGGAGIIRNNLTTVVRNKTGSEEAKYDDFPGRDKSFELMVPVNLGITFYFADAWSSPRLALNLNLQSTITLGEGLDGYDSSAITMRDGYPDIYNYYSIGIRYYLGPLGISKR